jgi:putative PIN family toxin of toxin-antitoxin system
VSRRVVFDTTTVVSALMFTTGRLAWLRNHWAERACIPLISRATAAELELVLRYPKVRLSSDERHELLGTYLPCCEVVEITNLCASVCRDEKDQPFLDLAQSGLAEVLVSGDRDLLALDGKTDFLIENPEAYRRRVFGG